MIASRRICYGAERTTIGPAAIAKDSAVYTRVDAPTEKKKLPVHYAETRLSEASTRATAGAIFQTEIVKRSRRITVFCFEIHIGTRIRIVSACQIPFLRKNIEGLYNRNRVRSRRITVLWCSVSKFKSGLAASPRSVLLQDNVHVCTSTVAPERPPPPPFPQMLRPRSSRYLGDNDFSHFLYKCSKPLLPRGGTKKKMPARGNNF